MHHNIFIILPLEGSMAYLIFLSGDHILGPGNSEAETYFFFPLLRKPIVLRGREVHLGIQVHVLV